MPNLLLVRHADAGTRGVGAADALRPLNARGQRQALALVDLLVPFVRGPERGPVASEVDARADTVQPVAVCSSPAVRCRDTVTPLAIALGEHVELDDALFEGADVGALLSRAGRLTRPTVWASHGDVIPALLRLVALRGVDLGPDPTCRKASTWLLEIHDGEVTAARGFLPPDVTRIR